MSEAARNARKRLSAMKSERSSWDAICRDVRDYLLPYHGRYDDTDVNRGERRDTKIIDTSATRFARACSAGLLSNTNSAARPWFRLTLADQELANYDAVKVWLAKETEASHLLIHRTNTYKAFHQVFDEACGFGTGVAIMRPRFETVLHLTPVTNGRYCIAQNEWEEVDTCYREMSLTAEQIVREFGLDVCSEQVKRAYGDAGTRGSRFTVVHAIEPRDDNDRDADRRDGRNKRWRSLYFEAAGQEDQYLREDGFDTFPVIAPRWGIVGGDVYGNGPGFEVLGHVKQLQVLTESELRGVEYGAEPPLAVPTGTKERDVNRVPGGITPVDMASPNSGVRELWKVQLDMNSLRASKEDTRNQIRRGFFADVFETFTGMEGDRRTAEEIRARREEQMLLLGPVVSAMQREKDGPFLRMLFAERLKHGLVSEPPPEIEGQELQIEYVSVLAQAQRMIGANNIDRFMFSIGQLATVKPDVTDVIDTDRVVRDLADRLSIHPENIVPGERVALVREARAKANAAKEQSLMMEQQAKAARDLGSVTVGGAEPNMVDALGALTGYGQ